MKDLDYKKNFKDSCGFGLIVNLDNQASHWLLKTAVESLARLSHRGAIASDGKTGDGCGILLKKPDDFFQAIAKEHSIKLSNSYAVAALFLNQNKAMQATATQRIDKELRQEGLEMVLEREVPINPELCGADALATLPKIVQIFINCPNNISEDEFERKLYIVRRRIEIAFHGKDPQFYIASFSSRVISYKGMLLPQNLALFYLDLQDQRMSTSLCLYHQRFSTNTFPEWRLAQPFRMLAHNGEINTIQGNRNWSISREAKYASPLIKNLKELMPIVSQDGSDSMSLDNMLEGLVITGVDFLHAIRILIPPAWQNSKTMDPNLKAMYEYYSLHIDPWDGPAGLVLTDGRYAVCSMDRNGLRPARYVLTKDRHLTMASEIGVYDYAPEDVITKGKLAPGEMLAIDTQTSQILMPSDIDKMLASKNKYKEWIEKYTRYIETSPEEETPGCDPFFDNEIKIYEKQFQLSLEEREQSLKATAENSQEFTYSMGDDLPLAVLSEKPRSLYDYFRQQFAQVTNPPIDPIREKQVMSLRTCLGKEVNPFVEEPENAIRIDIKTPILSRSMFKALLLPDDPNFSYETIDITYPIESDLETALQRICDKAERAVLKGKVFLIITDKRIKANRIPIHALLATGAIHSRLNAKGLRCDANLIVETATARDPHHFAVLIGFGATAIYPYLAYQVIYDMAQKGLIETKDTVELMAKYRDGIEKGLYKIISKMGISTINSYRGAQLFEALGLHQEIIDLCFPGTTSRIEGATFKDLEFDQRILQEAAWNPHEDRDLGGLLKAHPNGEYHAFNPELVILLQNAVRNNSEHDYKKFSSLVNSRPFSSLRDMFTLKSSQKSISIDQVEAPENLFKCFSISAMSLGAISPEAHEAIAIAMNRLGAKSNSGEGGEDPCRFNTEKNSKIKQVASGRFGVTPEYLMNAEEIQIKISQGAKPGEGGQLPGFKVNELIARLRHTSPGQTLISPPPHHDIYSIEDLSQLIFDLKQINPKAMISVKLVSEFGVGTVAAGVAKAYADGVTIAGHDGGTGASPYSSIRYAGVPWELGLIETQLTLKANGLRDKIKIQIDGGLKTGLDVIKAAILGAETFGFGTIALVTLGCKFLRVCHLNNCATGIATQNPALRKDFKGLPEHIENYFRFITEEVREYLAYLGVSSLNEIIGKTELLEILPGKTSKQKNLNLKSLLISQFEGEPEYCLSESNPPFDKAVLSKQMLKDSIEAIRSKSKASFTYPIKNINRSIGALISSEISRLHGGDGLPENTLDFNFSGTAGQSFGVFNSPGVNLILEGDANDYVGKGMAGGNIIIYPPKNSIFESHKAAIIGNTCLYGATGGKLFAAGQAGERFAVRNSGVVTVVEGIGEHGCEYMTGGVVVVLGKTGTNFGAGMTGGIAFVLDEDNIFPNNYNDELVEIIKIDKLPSVGTGEEQVVGTGLDLSFNNSNEMNHYARYLQSLVEEFTQATNSKRGAAILKDFDKTLSQIWLVKPKSVSLKIIYDYQQQPIYRTAAN